jgi:DNA-binding transcriptional ArsR family regulator
MSNKDCFSSKEGDLIKTSGHCALQMNDKMLELAASRFSILGEPYRLRILQVLKRGPMTVGLPVQSLDGNQSNVSKHLQLLYGAGIVDRKREGMRIVYSLRDPSVFGLCQMVHRNEIKKRQDRLKAAEKAR